jgi:3-methyladenine DNA glycosylase AlkD
MTRTQVFSLLKENQNLNKIEKWNKRYSGRNSLKTFGLGLTVLRKLAKQIGRDRNLALQLWDSDIYDAQIIGLLIDDPKQITREQAERQVEHVEQGHLAHVFSSCDASLSKTSFVADLLVEWINSNDETRQRCGYGLLYELSKSKKKSAPDDAYFLDKIKVINKFFPKASNLLKASMGGALIGMGKRNAVLNQEALKVAKKMGPIPIESESGTCEPFNVVKHLTSDYIKNKLGV